MPEGTGDTARTKKNDAPVAAVGASAHCAAPECFGSAAFSV